MRCLQSSCVFLIEVFPHGDIFQFCAGDEIHSARVRRFSGEHFLNERIVCTKLRSEIGKRIGQSQYFVIIIDRFGREELQFERFARAVAKLRNPFAVRFNTFVNRAR